MVALIRRPSGLVPFVIYFFHPNSLTLIHVLFIFVIDQWHPDKNPGDQQATKNFQKISEAYATLSDDKKRKIYDQYGKEAADQMGEDGAAHFPTGGGGGGMPFHFSQGGQPGNGGVHGMSSAEAEQFFSSFFGHDDPFGGGGFGRNHVGGPRIRMSPGMPGMSQSMGGGDPMSMFFGMPGMSGGGMPGSSMQFGGAPSRRPMQKRYDAIPTGTIVSFKGLKAKADRNGDRGEVQEYDPYSGRYTVLVEDSDELLKVKAENLLQHVQVVLSGIESQPILNDKTGTIIAWDEHKGRYNIYVMALSKTVSLKPANVILNNGTVGKIAGLSSKPDLNGKYGTIKSYVRDSKRYDIQISESQILRLKLENVHV